LLHDESSGWNFLCALVSNVTTPFRELPAVERHGLIEGLALVFQATPDNAGEAQREAIIEPDRALDDFKREAVASVTDFGHSGRLSARARTQQGAGRDNAIFGAVSQHDETDCQASQESNAREEPKQFWHLVAHDPVTLYHLEPPPRWR
jgi:hypothetical protein